MVCTVYGDKEVRKFVNSCDFMSGYFQFTALFLLLLYFLDIGLSCIHVPNLPEQALSQISMICT